MNWSYISGFFDADGSVTLSKLSKNCNKTLQLSFHNNEKYILEEIRDFILQDTGCKGVISIKKAKKESHNDSYDLKYFYRNAVKIAKNLTPIHKKKIHRISVYFLIQEITPRNGKYTLELKKERDRLENLFWEH